jgi:hypothetical protein
MKNFVSIDDYFVRELPFIHVKSAKANGSVVDGVSSVRAVAASGGAVGVTGVVAFAVVTGIAGCSCALALLGSVSSSLMHFVMASSSFATAGVSSKCSKQVEACEAKYDSDGGTRQDVAQEMHSKDDPRARNEEGNCKQAAL